MAFFFKGCIKIWSHRPNLLKKDRCEPEGPGQRSFKTRGRRGQTHPPIPRGGVSILGSKKIWCLAPKTKEIPSSPLHGGGSAETHPPTPGSRNLKQHLPLVHIVSALRPKGNGSPPAIRPGISPAKRCEGQRPAAQHSQQDTQAPTQNKCHAPAMAIARGWGLAVQRPSR